MGMQKKTCATVLAVLILLPFTASAASIRAGERPTVSASERIVGDIYMGGANVTSSGAVFGDEIAAGGNILINSAVSQDLMLAGGSITVLGNVGESLRVAGGNIVISGAVKRDVAAAGGQVQISGSGIGGDVIWAGGTITIDAPVAGDLHLRGGEVLLNAPVKGDVFFTGGKLTLGSSAVIQGNLSYSTPEKATMQDGAVVRGKVTYEATPKPVPSPAAFVAFLSIAFILHSLMVLACALVVGLVFNSYARQLVSQALSQPLLELGRGFATLAMLPVASVLLFVTVIGVPLGVLGVLGFLGALVYSTIIAPIVLGSLLNKWFTKSVSYEVSWQTILLGAVVYVLLGLIPFVGWIAKLALVFLSIGAATKIKWDVMKAWR